MSRWGLPAGLLPVSPAGAHCSRRWRAWPADAAGLPGSRLLAGPLARALPPPEPWARSRSALGLLLAGILVVIVLLVVVGRLVRVVLFVVVHELAGDGAPSEPDVHAGGHFKGDGLVVQRPDRPVHASERHHLIAHVEAFDELALSLLSAALGPDQHHVEDDHHEADEDQGSEGRPRAAGRSEEWADGSEHDDLLWTRPPKEVGVRVKNGGLRPPGRN